MSEPGFLYGTGLGQLCLRVLTRPWLSKLAGAFLSTGLSRVMIGGFIRRNGIDMSDYESVRYRSFNDFFTRALRPGVRPLPEDSSSLMAPCDSRVSVYTIGPQCQMRIKGQRYSVAALLGMEEFDRIGQFPPERISPEGDDPLAQLEALADSFDGGTALVFRLCVDDYHRYVYFDDGEQGENVHIPGLLHTVRPQGLQHVQVLARNSREYCVMDTVHFGRAVHMEVGAMMVGRIANHYGSHAFTRGEEKGMFLFGGSTVVLLLGPQRVRLRDDLEQARDRDIELRVLLGQAIGRAIN